MVVTQKKMKTMENPRTVIYKKALTGNIFGVLNISGCIW